MHTHSGNVDEKQKALPFVRYTHRIWSWQYERWMNMKRKPIDKEGREKQPPTMRGWWLEKNLHGIYETTTERGID